MANIRGYCSVCTKHVLDCQKAVYCSICCKWVHFKCTILDNDEYCRISNSPENWYCSMCLGTIFPFNHIEDNIDFFDCLYCNSKINSINAQIITNPVQFKISSKFTLNRNDIDPDKYFYKTHQTAESCYYLEDGDDPDSGERIPPRQDQDR